LGYGLDKSGAFASVPTTAIFPGVTGSFRQEYASFP
jgi:hypothetical protein